MKKFIYFIAFMAITVASAQDYSATIQNYLNENRSTFSLQPQDVESVKVTSQSYSSSMKVENVYVTQQYQGISIAKTSSPFAIKEGIVKLANLSFVQGIEQKVNTTTASISPADAIASAITALDLEAAQNLDLMEVYSPQSYEYSNGGIALDNIKVDLMYAKSGQELILSWQVSIYVTSGLHHYIAMIDANTGALVTVDDLVISCSFGDTPHTHTATNDAARSFLFDNVTPSNMLVDGSQYRVYPLPVESPLHGAPALISEPADVVASPFGWHDTDGVAGPEFTITRGNNVHAQDDFDGNNGTLGDAPDGGTALDFDFGQNSNTAPRNNIDGATVNLFYMNNVMHDIWYLYGFDEASGNYQANNYGNGGSQGDAVVADAQDGSGLDNATFGPNTDGGAGRMNMFLWTAGGGEIGEPLTVTGGPLAGSYEGVPGSFGDPLPPESNPLSGTLALVIDNDAGDSVDPNDACDPFTNAADIDGNIAVIRRGECEFGFKVLAAENAGAIAAIVVNNEGGDPIPMGAGDDGGSVTIPSIMVSQADGEALIAALLNGDTIDVTLNEVPPYQPDGSLDNGVVAHEYGHGISTRLTGGRFNSSCLATCINPSNGTCGSISEQMGEGWSDWFALMLTIQNGQDGTERRGIGTYVRNQPITGQGIRNFPYSTDTAINPPTYADVANPSFSAPHGVGSVWATMLWDLTWRFIDDFGFDPDLYNGTGGNNMVMQLVIDALKLQPCNPGFEDGRDAILEADELANGGANRCRIWEVFAARGLGASADQGSSLDRFDGAEAFNVPAGPNCTLDVADNFESNFSIYPNPSNGVINISSLVAAGDATVAIYDVNGRQVFSQNVTLQNLVTINAGSLRTGVYVVTISGDNFTHNAKIVIR